MSGGKRMLILRHVGVLFVAAPPHLIEKSKL